MWEWGGGVAEAGRLELRVLHSCGQIQNPLNVMAGGAMGPYELLGNGANHTALFWGCSESTWEA